MNTHQKQLDQLDAEIAAMEGTGQTQQPAPIAETVVPPQGQQPGVVEVDVITSVEEFQDGSTLDAADQQQGIVADEEPIDEPGSVMDAAAGRKSWKTEYQNLENRYVKLRAASDSYKFESRQQIATLQEQLLELGEQNDALMQKIAGYEAAAGKVSITSQFSPEDVEALGADTLNSFQKAVDMAVEARTKPLETQLLQMKKAERDRLRGAAEVNRSQAYLSFEEQLGNLVPNYRQINIEKGFIEWLRQPSQYTGVPRINNFRNAEKSGDVERVAQYFVEYQQITTKAADTLAASVTPSGRGGGGAAPRLSGQGQGTGKKVFSNAFVNQFYDDDIAGKYRGREALRDQLDKEIDLALKEGRVI